MKILLTLFVLFFSFTSNSSSPTDLSGKSIICIGLQDDNENVIVKMWGFDFITSDKVDFYFLSTFTDEITYANSDWNKDFIYSSNLYKIFIKNGRDTYTINRDTLVISTDSGPQFAEGECEVFLYEDIWFNMKKISETFEQKILKKNKI